MHTIGQRLEPFNDGLFDGGFGVAFNFRQACELRLSLDQRDDGLLMMLADDRVGLPVAEPRLVGHYSWALVNAFAIRQLAATVILAIAFAALLLTAQMLVELAALLFVSIEVLANAFVARCNLTSGFASAADLFGRPV